MPAPRLRSRKSVSRRAPFNRSAVPGHTSRSAVPNRRHVSFGGSPGRRRATAPPPATASRRRFLAVVSPTACGLLGANTPACPRGDAVTAALGAVAKDAFSRNRKKRADVAVFGVSDASYVERYATVFASLDCGDTADRFLFLDGPAGDPSDGVDATIVRVDAAAALFEKRRRAAWPRAAYAWAAAPEILAALGYERALYVDGDVVAGPAFRCATLADDLAPFFQGGACAAGVAESSLGAAAARRRPFLTPPFCPAPPPDCQGVASEPPRAAASDPAEGRAAKPPGSSR